MFKSTLNMYTVILAITWWVVTVEVRDVAQNQLVTSIEILSPVNKREAGLTNYRHKWERLEQAGVHLMGSSNVSEQ